MLPAAAACKVKIMSVQPEVNVPETAVLFTGQKFLDIQLSPGNLSQPSNRRLAISW